MAAGKERLYWSVVVIYGMVLVAVLLYFRFPTETFRRFCERKMEEMTPGSEWAIGSTRLDLPLAVSFIDIEMRDEGENAALFEAAKLSLAPVWTNPLAEFRLEGSAYGGSLSARLLLDDGGQSIMFDEIDLADLQLDALPWLQRRLGRKITGLLSGRGSATVSGKPLSLVAARGEIGVSDGRLALMRPILELDSLDLDRSAVSFSLAEDSAVIEEGLLENRKLKMTFQGNLRLASPITAGEIELQGTLTPQPPLFEDNRQLRIIVTRMQKRYGNVALPFTVGGTVGRPTFVFKR